MLCRFAAQRPLGFFFVPANPVRSHVVVVKRETGGWKVRDGQRERGGQDRAVQVSMSALRKVPGLSLRRGRRDPTEVVHFISAVSWKCM